jgi:hypothetical protein
MTDDSIKERMENEYTDLLIEYFKKSNESLFDVNLVNLVKSYNKENDYIVIRSMYDFARYRNSIVLK